MVSMRIHKMWDRFRRFRLRPVQPKEYMPDYAVPPGATLSEELDTRQIRRADFARRLGTSTRRLEAVIFGIEPITDEMADDLECQLDITAEFWRTRERSYRATLARLYPKIMKPF